MRKTRPTMPVLGGQPVEDLPDAAHGLAAQAAVLGEVDRRQQPAAGEVVDDRLARVARRAGALEVALEPAAWPPGGRPARRRRRRAATPRRGGRRASPGRSRSPSRAAPRAPPGARRPRRRRGRRPRGRTPRWRAARPRGCASRSTPATIPRESLRKSGRMSATYSSDVKPAPASSTATSAPRAIHGRSRSRSSAWFRTVSCSVSSITSRDGSLPASSSSPGWPSASGERLTHSSRPWGGTPAAAIARQQATSRSSRRPARAAAASVTSGGSATRPGGVGKRARPS